MKHPEGSDMSRRPTSREHLCPREALPQVSLQVLFASGCSNIQDHSTGCSQEDLSPVAVAVSPKPEVHPLQAWPSVPHPTPSVLPIHWGLEVSGHQETWNRTLTWPLLAGHPSLRALSVFSFYLTDPSQEETLLPEAWELTCHQSRVPRPRNPLKLSLMLSQDCRAEQTPWVTGPLGRGVFSLVKNLSGISQTSVGDGSWQSLRRWRQSLQGNATLPCKA